MNLPNILTLMRVVLTFTTTTLLFINYQYFASIAVVVFFIAGITDWFDGYIARKYNIITNDIFDFNYNLKFDKILCNYPWGIRFEKYELDYIIDKISKMKFNWNKISNSSADWLFIDALLTLMSDSGKAAAIMTGGPLFKINDENFRKDLIENHLIESVIKLPVVTNYTSLDQYLVVFSNNNDKVILVDLS